MAHNKNNFVMSDLHNLFIEAQFMLITKKIDYYRRHGIPISYLRAGVQSLIMNLLQFLSLEQTIIILLVLELVFKVIKI